MVVTPARHNRVTNMSLRVHVTNTMSPRRLLNVTFSSRCGATKVAVGDLEALEAVARLGLLADDVEDRVDELGALGVVALGPVVAGAGLAEDEVVRAEELAEGARAHRVPGAGLEVHEHGAGPTAAGGFMKYTLMRSSWRSESPWYVAVGSMPCSSEMTSQNLAPTWLPHWLP